CSLMKLKEVFTKYLQDHVKKLKRELEGWREIILQLHSPCCYGRTSGNPGLVAGVSTAIFTLLWLLEPSLLTTVSFIGLLVTLLDYLVPTVCAGLYRPENWTGAKEKQFEEICRTLALCYSAASHQLQAFKELKVTSPKLYYSVTITSLAVLAYIGNKVDNLFLSYILGESQQFKINGVKIRYKLSSFMY
ncbi:ADP-ribosylation factor-like protein 6-interacting protein 1, partial [Homalodisca vitripennis]|uniref:ADP-ribosylation factor-like protein 6-interacting protein 1 n=1 Tax=Homalodisca vitripennis TaxID=197043 RepID=UPI001EE9F9A5